MGRNNDLQLSLTENERAFVKRFQEYYQESNGELSDYQWRKLGEYRKSLDITIGRSAQITNNIEEILGNVLDELITLRDNDEYDNDCFQILADEYIEAHALKDSDITVGYYLKAQGWEKEFYILDEMLCKDEEMSDERKDEIVNKRQKANSEAIRNIDKALQYLD